MTDLDRATCARIPADALLHLAPLRARSDVRAFPLGEALHVFFPPGDHEALQRLLSVRGAELFERRADRWYRPGGHLPVTGIPDPAEAVSLPRLLAPAPVRPEMIGGPDWRRAPLTLARDDHPRPTSALRLSLAALADWADTATTRQFDGLSAAIGPGGVALVRGARLPALLGGERYWGARLLVPLGFRPDPPLAEVVLLQALGAGPTDFVVLTEGSAERVPAGAFAPLTRASVRLVARG